LPLRKLFHWGLLSLFLLPALLILAEFAYFLQMTRSNPVLHKADLIAAFTGEYGRVEEGFRLADRGLGPYLLVSRASLRKLARYQKRLKSSNTFRCIPEPKARTTFENALHTKRIMSSRGMHSVILVTSWDHMPRSYLLLKIVSYGSGIRIQCERTRTGSLEAANWYRFSKGWKRAYNEMVQLWGSLYEMAAYRIRGRVSPQAPNQTRLVTLLRKLLLFHINQLHS